MTIQKATTMLNKILPHNWQRNHCAIRSMVVLLVLLITSSHAAADGPSAANATENPTHKARPNVLLICIDDLRPELNCFGVDYIHSPNIDQLAKSGLAFTRHYVHAPTCGASRAALLSGKYMGTSNGALFARAEAINQGKKLPPSLPGWFKSFGYTTVSVGKVSHHPGGYGGPDWNDESKPEMPNAWDRSLLPAGAWKHPRGWMHGLAHGEIRANAKDMDLFQSIAGEDSIYPDGISTESALQELKTVAADKSKPFFLAVGILRPHLPFGAPAKYMEPYQDAVLPPTPHAKKPAGKTTWHGSGEFMKYNRWNRNPNNDPEFAIDVRKHYAACVTFADAQVGRILKQLKKSGAADNTIVVLWGDHGWHLGEHAIWGKHTLFEESLRSPLIIKHPGLKTPGQTTNAIVESIDLFPTLCELARIDKPDFLAGTSLRPLLDGQKPPHKDSISYFKNARTIRTDTHRLIHHKDGYNELYDHTSPAGETKNIANEHPPLVQQLIKRLNDRR
ncbi:MAG: iduronate 2-sulfatase [Mariniblastus sp.]|jgi:iduronate 2-sulfatase